MLLNFGQGVFQFPKKCQNATDKAFNWVCRVIFGELFDQMKKLVDILIFVTLVTALPMVPVLPADCSEYYINERVIPEQYQDEFGFLELIKWPHIDAVWWVGL